jgi:hypothetical protein
LTLDFLINRRHECRATKIALKSDLYARYLLPSIANQPPNLGKTANYPIPTALRLLKGSTARACNLVLKRSGPFWNHESYDHYVRNEQELERTIKYILNNPVKAELVEEWKDWQFTYVNPELGSW